MKNYTALIFGLMVLIFTTLASSSCSGFDNSLSINKELECNRSDRAGSYVLEFEELEGDCGVPAGKMISKGIEVPIEGCDMNYERWSERNCKYEASLTCKSWDGDVITTGAVSSVQKDSSGDVLIGTIAFVSMRVSTGESCESRYKVIYYRIE